MRILLPRIHAVLRAVQAAEAIYRPIKIDTLLAAVKQTGVVNEIKLIPSDILPDVLLAKIIVKRLPSGRIANIYYSKNASKPEQRFAIAKETVHIFDDPKEKTTPDTDLEKLLDDLCVDGSDPPTEQIASEKAGLPPRGREPVCRALQSLPHARKLAMHACDGARHRGPRLDDCGFDRSGFGNATHYACSERTRAAQNVPGNRGRERVSRFDSLKNPCGINDSVTLRSNRRFAWQTPLTI